MHSEYSFTAEEMGNIKNLHIEFVVKFARYCRLFNVPKDEASLLLQGAFMVMSMFPFYDDTKTTIIYNGKLNLCYGREE